MVKIGGQVTSHALVLVLITLYTHIYPIRFRHTHTRREGGSYRANRLDTPNSRVRCDHRFGVQNRCVLERDTLRISHYTYVLYRYKCRRRADRPSVTGHGVATARARFYVMWVTTTAWWPR